MAPHEYTSLILDLGGVLANYSPQVQSTSLTPRQVMNALDSPCWHDFECGKVSRQECYAQLAATFTIDLDDWQLSLKQMMKALKINKELICAVRHLKKAHPKLRVYGLSNISEPDFKILQSLIQSWEIFDEFYASSESGHRKPHAGIYKYFLDRSGERARNCIFVDDKLDNVVAARLFGFREVLFEGTESVVRILHNLLERDAVARGMAFLRSQVGHLFCETTSGEKHKDNYSQLLILQNTGDRSLVTLDHKGRSTWNYFIGTPVFAGTAYPDDSDTTSLAMSILDDVSSEDKKLAMESILSHLSPDGLPYRWLDGNRPRVCHNICASVFRFFCANGRRQDLPAVYDYLCDMLSSKAYLLGSRYYESPDWFLYNLADLFSRCPADQDLEELRDLVKRRVSERAGCDQKVWDACLRLMSAQLLGLESRRDLECVLDAQQLDGGWEQCTIWRCGKEPIGMRSRGVVTAMAVNGIRMARERS
ncbi:hypothetical protein GQ602_006971 [Ophiocordyceps camponoti-floridani]|uniref:Uncharacterized protein n=1 Tax=Ophiocordyceps camponoti-floridani TaxID=2030778 RepID=A0A8H4VAJ5_9HYPO|nr:hypothetical protein GQ602_006971 [Ophiocordyceps camponoti-floridani]